MRASLKAEMSRPSNPAKPIVDALLQRFLPLAGRRIDTAQAQDGQYLRASEPAYEQVLDSLAMAAHYTPLPLLEALSKWRESDIPRVGNDASTVQRKLAVECIFCSACIRFVECCPPEGLTENSWMVLETFVFDWLTTAEKFVSQTDYPSLVDLRGLLLDLVARLLGALSRIRFNSITERFFEIINPRRLDLIKDRNEVLSLISGMRYLKLGVNTVSGLKASTSFIANANPLTWTPQKKKTELHHALCNMLFSILAPVADAGKGQWPPSGVDVALKLWYDAVLYLRSQLMQWMDKQNKHVIVGYPLVTLLLCLGDPQSFNDNFGIHMEHLYKLLRDKNLRAMALDCLHRVIRFYLNVYAEKQPKNRVWDYLHSVTSQLLVLLKRGSLTQDAQHDKVVEFCLTIAESNLDFAMNHMILDLLRNDNPSEAKVIGLRALLAVVSSPSHHRSGSDTFKSHDSLYSATSSLQGSPLSPWLSSGSVTSSLRLPLSSQSSASTFSEVSHDISQYVPKVRAALDQIIRTCHSTYGSARLTSPKATLEPTKEKQQGWMVFKWALKCVPNLIPEIWWNDKMTEILPAYGISIEPGVREEAVQVLFRTVRALPYSRPAVMKGMANFILQLPDEFPLLIHTSLVRLVQLMQAWQSCLAEENLYGDSRNVRHMKGSQELNYRASPFRPGSSSKFSPHGMDAIGLIFLCSCDIQTRYTALELLRRVRALQNDIRKYSKRKSDYEELQPTFVIDVFEEAGDDIVQKCYWDPSRWYDLRREWDAVPTDVTLQSILESPDKSRWGRCLSELVKHAALLCPDAVDAARLEVVQRLSNMTGAQTQDFEGKLEQWHLYSMFACSCPPEESADAGTQAAKDIFNLVFPLLKSPSEVQVYAATLALAHTHVDLLEVMFTPLRTFLEEMTSESENRSKWKSQKLRRDDTRVHVATIYRMVADNIWPGMLSRKPTLRVHFARFIDETARYISSQPPEYFQDLQPLRYSLASVLRALAPELVKANPERPDPRTRKRLFELLASWCDDPLNAWAPDSVSDYRREIERYKSAMSTRTKDSMEKINMEREINEQVEAVQWIAMNAMAALLYGPCFDDSARKMTGRVITWINNLFLEHAPRVPMGYSPADPRAALHSKYSVPGVMDGFRGGVGGRERQKGGHFKVQLARTALMNLLQSNLDLFPACIDQCYSSDPSIANGYFRVLAEVYMRQEIPRCEIQRLLSLILYKVVDPSRQIRDDALQMLETLSAREWAEEGESRGRYRAAVVGNLPDSYQQFQYQLSAKLAKEHPELSEYLCEEIMQRQLDAVDIIAQHQVLTCMAPWIENLQLWMLKYSGWCERLLKSMYYVTWRHGDQFPDEIEQLWSTIAKKVKNIGPVLDFLIAKGMEDCDSNATGEISGAFARYFPVAKRISLYLARVSPQQTIDHLVCELAQRMIDDQPEQMKRAMDNVFEMESSNPVLEFSQGGSLQMQMQMQMQMFDPMPPMSPLLIRSSLEGGQARNVSGNLSWRTAATGGRSMSGPLNALAMPEIHTGRSGQLFTGSGPLNISGPLMAAVRTSTGSLKSRHLSRDSGDYYNNMDSTPTTEDIRSGTASALAIALQGHNHWISKADIALILLAEIAYENDEDFRGHLPLLFHVTFVSMDSSEDIVLEHCQQLLVNLLYSLAGRPLESYNGGDYGDGEDKKQVESLMKYVQSKKGSMMWEYEDMTLTKMELPSAALLSALVQSVVDAVFFQGDLRERWGEEALKWAMECSSRHMACRSHQIFRALRPPVTSDTCVSLLRCLHRCLSSSPSPSHPVLGFIMEILLSLQVIVETMVPEKVILYPQLFWACVAMLHTDYVHIYTQVLELFARVIDRLSLRDPTTQSVLLSSMPSDGRDSDAIGRKEEEEDFGYGGGSSSNNNNNNNGRPPPILFDGVQSLVLKGLMSTLSHASAIEVLSRITIDTCDSILGKSESRLLMHIIGMAPWLCLQLQNEQQNESSSPLQNHTQQPYHHQHQRACAIAGNISEWCESKNLSNLASLFRSYSESQPMTVDWFLERLSPLLCRQWFPRHSGLAFSHLLRLLEKVSPDYQRVILLFLRSLLQYTSMECAQTPQVYAIISQLVEGPLCREALKVLEALLQSCSSNSGVSTNFQVAEAAQPVSAAEDRARLVSQNSMKGRSGQLLHYSAAAAGGPGPAAEAAFPSREEALQNTRVALGKVLETYGSGKGRENYYCAGKRRDYRKLVPFVCNGGGGAGGLHTNVAN